jgi:hypothetical protein
LGPSILEQVGAPIGPAGNQSPSSPEALSLKPLPYRKRKFRK